MNHFKFTVVLHCSQKHFNVTVINYHNLSSYVQWQMNKILHIFHAFVQDYINDIVIFSKTLDKHLHHLHQMFQLFQNLDISLESKKFFLDYSTVILFKQWVDALDLFTLKKKIRVLTELQFLTIFRVLEIYLDLMSWLQSYILYYAQIMTSLQTHKMTLLKTSSIFKENTQKQHISHLSINDSSSEKLCAFEILQDLFVIFIFLAHFNSSHQLYINVDAFKQYDFSTVVYYVDNTQIWLLLCCLTQRL